MIRLAFGSSVLVLAVAVLQVDGCSKDDGPTGPGASYVGGWSGVTSQGRLFRFYVEPEGPTLAALRFELVGRACIWSTTTFLSSTDTTDHLSISGSALSIQNTSAGSTIDISGTFSSGSASGSFTVADATCDGAVNGTWAATRASGAEANVAGTWEGTQYSNLSTNVPITFLLTQSGSTLGGSYSSELGGYGSVSGSVSGKLARFTLTQTTPGCTGSFTGYAVLVDEPAGTEYIVYAWDGHDCLGSHTGGWGIASRTSSQLGLGGTRAERARPQATVRGRAGLPRY